MMLALNGYPILTYRVLYVVCVFRSGILCYERWDRQSFLQAVGLQRHVHVVSSCGGCSCNGKSAKTCTGLINF